MVEEWFGGLGSGGNGKMVLDSKGTHGKEKEWKCLWCVVYEMRCP